MGTIQVDQEHLQNLVEEWKQNEPTDNIFFRPQQSTEDKNAKLLFVYQSSWQRQLLKLYGNSMTLLDGTYRTSRYDIPLYFLCVRSNVKYIIVATFLPAKDSSEHIEEALQILKTWNPEWSPSAFMLDFCGKERKAIRAVWPGNSSMFI